MIEIFAVVLVQAVVNYWTIHALCKVVGAISQDARGERERSPS